MENNEIIIEISASWISIIAAVISFIAMIISGVSAHSSRKSYNLQEKKYNDGNPNFQINDILDSYAENDKNKDYIDLHFFILITNYSDKAMHMNKIRLKVVGEKNSIILKPIAQRDYAFDGENIAANNSLKKWVKFQIPRKQYEEIDILKYILSILDAYDNTSEFTSIYIREKVRNYEE